MRSDGMSLGGVEVRAAGHRSTPLAVAPTNRAGPRRLLAARSIGPPATGGRSERARSTDHRRRAEALTEGT